MLDPSPDLAMTPTRLSLFDLAPEKVLLDRYRIVSPHRENGMSAAFHVIDTGADGEAADDVGRELQAFPASLFENPKQAEAFADSLRPWSRLEHGAIAQLRDITVLDDGSVIVVSDFPQGHSLRDAAAKRSLFTVREAIELGDELLAGLAASHDAGLIHGDIKPSTIYIGGAGPLLVDGGVTPGLWAAKHLGTRTALIGTPYYAPIEQFGGDSPDERSDLYNLATVLYELVTGVMPWRGRTYIEVFQSKMQPEAPPMRSLAPDVEIDPIFESAIATALRGKRKERHESADAFRSALAQVNPA